MHRAFDIKLLHHIINKIFMKSALKFIKIILNHMKDLLCHGTILQCQYGLLPTPFKVLPQNLVKGSKAFAGNIMDNKPFVNITPFGMCKSLLNPMTIISPVGVIFPPCVPNISAPWLMPSTKVKIGKLPAINQGSKCMCMQGLGEIKPLITTLPRVRV